MARWIDQCAMLGLIAFTFACAKTLPSDTPNVLLVTFDTVRADHFGCYGNEKAETPNVDRLAREGLCFQQCISPIPITLPSHGSMLTGKYPHGHGVRNNASYVLQDDQVSVAEILQRAGFETAAFVSAFVLHAQYGLNQGFDVYDDTVRDSSAVVTINERPANETADAALEWLNGKHRRPFFLWVHFFDPHQSYMPPRQWAERFPEDPYSGEIAFADEQLGRILQKVSLDSTLVIFTGDHGEALGEHGERTHAFLTYDSTLRVPLVVRFPDGRQKGQRKESQTSLVDIAPTIVDYLNLPVPEDMDGMSLLDMDDVPDVQRYAYFESTYPLTFGWAPLTGLRSHLWKYIHAPKPELYHVSTDPAESENVKDSHPEVVRQIQKELLGMRTLDSLKDSTSQKSLNAEERRALASLGYVGSMGFASTKDLLSLPDPKDVLSSYLLYMDAGKMNRSGKHQAAELLLRGILNNHPTMFQARFLLGEVLADSGRYSEAMEIFDEILAENSSDPTVWYTMAVTCNKAQKHQKAIQICEAGLKVLPDEAGLFDQLGLAWKLQGNLDKATEFGRKAVEQVDDQPEYLNNLGGIYSAAGDFKNARRLLEKAIEIQPDFSEALYNLGVVFLRQEKYTEAEKRLRQAVQSDESNLDAWVQLNKALLYQQRSEQALEISQHLLQMQPGNPEVHYFMSVAYRQLRDYQKAEAALRHFLKINPGFKPAYRELVQVLLDQEPSEVDEARQVIQQAISHGIDIPVDLRRRTER